VIRAASDGRGRGRRSVRGRRRHGVIVILAIWLGVGATAWLGGCTPEARYRVLSRVFDGVPPPGTPKVDRRRRRVVREAPAPASEDDVSLEELELVLQGMPEPVTDYETYEDLLDALPKDPMRNIDWVAAAKQGSIRPLPGPDPETLESPILVHDVHLDPGVPGFEVVFPHAPHTYWLRCDNCHPAIFAMKAGANPITMEKIFEGEYCGKCHGKVAFSPITSCQRCHVKLGTG